MKRPLPFFITGLRLIGIAGVFSLAMCKKDDPPVPDEKRVAMIELEKKQSGPGYFHAEENSQPDEEGVRWIEPDKAAAQIDRVLSERKLGESERETLTKLINEISEPHPSRTIGGNRVNLARLNVALDADAR
ncbi:MAG TPA: potassium-transporting ATPase subunit C [Haloferula sp.]